MEGIHLCQRGARLFDEASSIERPIKGNCPAIRRAGLEEHDDRSMPSIPGRGRATFGRCFLRVTGAQQHKALASGTRKKRAGLYAMMERGKSGARARARYARAGMRERRPVIAMNKDEVARSA